MTPSTIFIIAFVAVALIALVLVLVLRKPKKDCVVKKYQEGACVDGSYNIIYDVSQSPQSGGLDCLTAVKAIDNTLTWTDVSGRWTGKAACNDCEFKDISYNACTSNKQTLRLDVSRNPVKGKACSDVATAEYGYAFTLDVSSGAYFARDVSCNNCDISLGTLAQGSCLGYNQRTEYPSVIKNSPYGIDCSTRALVDISNGLYDDTYNLAYYITACDVSNGAIPASTLRYGYVDATTKTGTDASQNSIKCYFDASSNLTGFEIATTFSLGDLSGTPVTFSDISNGKYITVGSGSAAQYFKKGVPMSMPIRIFANDGYMLAIQTVDTSDAVLNLTGATTGAITFKFTLTKGALTAFRSWTVNL